MVLHARVGFGVRVDGDSVAVNRKEISMQKDPVCQMEVDERSAAGQAMHEGKPCYFCAAESELSLRLRA
jgi:YHS domain-containing protein